MLCWICKVFAHLQQMRYFLEQGEGLCSDCSTAPPIFHVARSLEGLTRESYRIAIKALKFLGKKNLAVRMGTMMANVVKNEPEFWPLDVIVPVPLSKGTYGAQRV